MLVAGSVIMFQSFGIAALSGIALLVFYMPCQWILGKYFAKMRYLFFMFIFMHTNFVLGHEFFILIFS